MTVPTPAPTAPPSFDFRAELSPIDGFAHDVTPSATSWFVTHQLGGPARNTYTEVALAPEVAELPERVVDRVVFAVAEALYGRSWAFHYRPEQYDEAIARWSMRRRERVVVSSVEVYS